ncbi:hypothetical protein FIV00_26545 [Labrenzia sp. THAF82]|uniref:DUF2274 domain-containing protein n=1 Tax=Labrenzia sp. THAF82 TaxID=2587861 RepID=UPI001268D9C2|nr:DUF2274 domain-containing protein [Labrenzia sp. THAF82]QFT34083.1 hypothetical protein FIV00_26545 [Labrenzia sp. THAF82]
MATKLKLTRIPDDKPVKLTVELPADIHQDLVVYAEVMAKENGQQTPEPARLIAPMLQRFMLTDRAFLRLKKERRS